MPFESITSTTQLLRSLRFSLRCHRIKPNNFRIFVSFFLTMTSVYLLTAGVEGYCCTWSHSMTHTHTHARTLLWTSDRHVAQTSTWQQTTLTRTRNRCERAAAVLRLRTFESKNCKLWDIKISCATYTFFAFSHIVFIWSMMMIRVYDRNM